MKKTSFKSIIHGILALSLVSLLASCSADDKDSVAINNVTVNKNNSYINEKIILTFDGTGYTDANLFNLTTTSPIRYTKVEPTTFEITSAVSAQRALVFLQLKNDTNKTESSLEVNFFIHGVENFTYAEGIKPADPSSKVLQLLGEPTNKTATTITFTKTDDSTTPATVTTTTAEGEKWAYPTKGISVTIEKSNGVARIVNLYSSGFYTTMPDGSKVFYTDYPGDLGNGWKINNANTKMDAVITKLGTPTAKDTDVNNPTLRIYTFSNNTKFSFFGTTVDDYKGKVIQSFTL